MDYENCWDAVRKIGEALVLDDQGAGGHAFRVFLIYRAEHGDPGDQGPTCGDLLDANSGLGGGVLAEINAALGLPPTTVASETIRAARTAAAASRREVVQKTEVQVAGLERAAGLAVRAAYFGAIIGTSDKELITEHGADNE